MEFIGRFSDMNRLPKGEYLFERLCSQTLILKYRSVQQLLISASGCSLSAGWAVSLLGATHLWGLNCPTAPAGVSHLTLQSTTIFGWKQQSFRKEPFEKTSPGGLYTLKAYLTNGGATTSYAVRGELVFNEDNNKAKNIYWNEREETANITWTDNDTVEINGLTLDVPDDKFDFRHQWLITKHTDELNQDRFKTLNSLLGKRSRLVETEAKIKV